MLVICAIIVAVNVDGLPWNARLNVEGVVREQSMNKYLVDFSSGVGKYSLVGNPEDYSRVLVDQSDCKTLQPDRTTRK